jgi:hypothetical protein
MVFRKYKGKTTVYIKQERNSPLSEKEKAHRLRFKEATLYGKSINNNPALKAEYQLQADLTDAPTAYAAAVADYLSTPEITSLDLENYKGEIGDKIVIKAVDDFRVASVRVVIKAADNTEIESGLAVITPNNISWEYTVQKASQAINGQKITVSASDLPGNVTKLEKLVN